MQNAEPAKGEQGELAATPSWPNATEGTDARAPAGVSKDDVISSPPGTNSGTVSQDQEPLLAEIVDLERGSHPTGTETETGNPFAPGAMADRTNSAAAAYASIESSPQTAAPRRRRPQPGLVVALLLTWLPIFMQIVVVAVISIGVVVAYAVATGKPNSGAVWIQENQAVLLPVGTFTTLVVAVAIAYLFYGRAAGRCVAFRGLAPTQLLASLMLVLPLQTLASELTNIAQLVVPLFEPAFFQSLRETNQAVFGQLIERSWLLTFVGACLLPGLGEEIFARGFIGRGLVSRYGLVVGVTFTSFLFGAMHVDPVQGTGAMALGFALHYVYLMSRSLWAPIVLHTLNNASAFAFWATSQQVWVPGLTAHPDEQVSHTPILLLLASFLSAAAWCWFLYGTRTRWHMPDGSLWNPGFPTAEMPPAGLGCQPLRKAGGRIQLVVAMLSTALFLVALYLVAERPSIT
jgi:membrane protease YdiL (CAAX protease family)